MIRSPYLPLSIMFVASLVLLIYQISVRMMPSITLILMCVGSGYAFNKLSQKKVKSYKDILKAFSQQTSHSSRSENHETYTLSMLS